MILYVKTGCPWCIDAEAYLRRAGYEFQEVNVHQDAAAFEEMKKISGQTYAPTLRVGDLVLADFDTAQLQTFLDQHAIHPE